MPSQLESREAVDWACMWMRIRTWLMILGRSDSRLTLCNEKVVPVWRPFHRNGAAERTLLVFYFMVALNKIFMSTREERQCRYRVIPR